MDHSHNWTKGLFARTTLLSLALAGAQAAAQPVGFSTSAQPGARLLEAEAPVPGRTSTSQRLGDLDKDLRALDKTIDRLGLVAVVGLFPMVLGGTLGTASLLIGLGVALLTNAPIFVLAGAGLAWLFMLSPVALAVFAVGLAVTAVAGVPVLFLREHRAKLIRERIDLRREPQARSPHEGAGALLMGAPPTRIRPANRVGCC